MKKSLFLLMAILAVGFCLNACGSDDDVASKDQALVSPEEFSPEHTVFLTKNPNTWMDSPVEDVFCSQVIYTGLSGYLMTGHVRVVEGAVSREYGKYHDFRFVFCVTVYIEKKNWNMARIHEGDMVYFKINRFKDTGMDVSRNQGLQFTDLSRYTFVLDATQVEKP
ncbi:hypothetical protein [Segatella buccae]|uniref:hypothetical protein n=1 Tax=Segatella buccae TaxID=28126 RepID=UPI0028D6C102|nr:hypothetical protein [Segatella buccae]